MTKLQISQITEFIEQFRRNRKEHVDRIPERFLKYQPKGRRSLGLSLK
jgi:hypothetical protein